MKKAKTLVRVLLVLLSLCMLVSVFAACTDESGKEGEPATTPGKEQETGPATGADGKILDDLPQLNLNREFTILAVESQRKHFRPTEEEATDNVYKAIIARNATVEERMGVTFKWVLEPGQANAEEISSFIQKVETDYKGDCEYEAVISYNLVPYPLANRGLCQNLADTKYIDLTGPWWPSIFVERLLYKDQIYALVNSCGYGTLTNMTAIYFHNGHIEDKGITSPYEQVANNNWTIETLKASIKDTYQDLDADSKAAADKDLFGLCTSTNARLTCWYVGAGGRLSDLDGDGKLALTVGSEQFSNIMDSIVDLFSTEDSMVTDAKQYTMFYEERAVFYLAPLTLSSNIVKKGLEIDYGVAPIPKLTSAQERYYTHVPNTHEAWFISAGAKDVDTSSYFLECMASEAYRQVDPIFYEANLKLRYAPDERLAGMYDLVRDSISFDFLYIYKNILANDVDKTIRTCIAEPTSSNWSSSWAGIQGSVETDFQKILDTYEMRQ